eukprot:scaffold1373_cov134-Skeletonema_marinoi.AAC.7
MGQFAAPLCSKEEDANARGPIFRFDKERKSVKPHTPNPMRILQVEGTEVERSIEQTLIVQPLSASWYYAAIRIPPPFSSIFRNTDA